MDRFTFVFTTLVIYLFKHSSHFLILLLSLTDGYFLVGTQASSWFYKVQ